MHLTETIPPRTSLYSIEPINNNSDEVESLNHYIYRLARLHYLKVNTLLKHCLNTPKPPQILTKNSHSIDYFTQESLIQCIERTTGRRDLSFTTLLYYKNVIASSGLHRLHHSWCPACLSENHQPVYERLSWTFKHVNTCLKHEYALIDQCTVCQKKIIEYKNYGYCNFCDYDLSSMKSKKKATLTELEITEKILSLITPYRLKEIPTSTCVNFFKERGGYSGGYLVTNLKKSTLSMTKALRFSARYNLPINQILDERLIQRLT